MYFRAKNTLKNNRTTFPNIPFKIEHHESLIQSLTHEENPSHESIPGLENACIETSSRF